jgi:hypothetical protein
MAEIWHDKWINGTTVGRLQLLANDQSCRQSVKQGVDTASVLAI